MLAVDPIRVKLAAFSIKTKVHLLIRNEELTNYSSYEIASRKYKL